MPGTVLFNRRRLLEWSLIACSLLLLFLGLRGLNAGDAEDYAAIDISGHGPAPELDGGLAWFNVEKPLTLEQLRGKVVLLDFWTYCCINCMHVLPELHRLEAKYPDTVVVIGVHSAKFDNEKQSDCIRQAILRYEISHPVVNDAEFKIWRSYGVEAWPSLVLIDPEGQLIGSVSGEGNEELLDAVIARLIEKHKDSMQSAPLAMALERDREARRSLSFPGKIVIDPAGTRLCIADSNHNRIVIAGIDGEVTAVIGDGVAGHKDGGFAEARFFRPQGMLLDGDSLYVADTENHLLRRVDLKTSRVETVAGTGAKGALGGSGPALATALNSPWDLARRGADPGIYIAMAGLHQLWRYDPETGAVGAFAGSGWEDIQDGPAATARLAQPSGLTSDGTHLYFADSEVSALRMVDFSDETPAVNTLIGRGLFKFGDKDGAFEDAKLQHCLGVLHWDGKLYIADAYNHKIKVADPAAETIATLLGNGKPGTGDAASPQLNEPAGLAAANGTLYIADTNNHRILAWDLKTHACGVLELKFKN